MTEPGTGREHLAGIVESVRVAAEEGRLDDAVAALEPLLPADAADVIEDLSVEEQRALLVYMADAIAADILEEMENPVAAEVAFELASEELAAILDQMEHEEAADVLGDLPVDQAESAMFAMDDAVEAEVRSLMVFPDDTAGGRMTPEFIALPADQTSAEAIESFRREARDLRGAYYFYTLDAAGRLLGVVNLRELITADPSQSLDEIMSTDVISIQATEDQETAARLMARYDLLALPVVDASDRLVGVIQNEDLVDVILEEATEDMYRLVGVGEEERPQTPVSESVRRRLPWLVLNLGTQLVLVVALKIFEPTIAEVALLAVLFPLVTGQGGNVGSQTMTLFVRSMALGEVDLSNQWRLLWKEVTVGLIMGVAIGLLAGIIALVIGGGDTMALQLAGAIWLAMGLNLAAGGLAGATVPLLLDRAGIDPALASAMFVTTITDTLGVVFFMGAFLLLT